MAAVVYLGDCCPLRFLIYGAVYGGVVSGAVYRGYSAMADQPGLLEKESAAPEMDKLLENTLVHNINIGGPLTRREAQILQLIVSGKTNKEIGRTLCRTERTIEYHRNRLYRKLDAHNAADLVRRAITMGIT